MIRRVRGQRRGRAQAEVQMAPLIDMVFILLIFFMVTTVFTRETGVEVNRPQASTAQALDSKSLMIGIDPNGEVNVDERRVDLMSLRSLIERKLQQQPEQNVILIADEDTRTAIVVAVMDECRMAGATSIALAAKGE
ncbi:MAG: biopolymer transporter ExbD [bacterium]